MKVVNILPNLFLGGEARDFTLEFYTTYRASKNNKVVLEQPLIGILLSGEKQIINDDGSIKVHNQEIFLASKGQVLMTEKLGTSQAFSSILFFVSATYLLAFIHRYGLDMPQYEAPKLQVLPKDTYLQHFELSLLSLSTADKNTPLWQIKMDEMLCYLYNHQAHSFATLMQNLALSSENINLRRVVENNITNKLKVEELAFLCNMSTSTFKRKFRALYGMPPKQYFIQERMQRACLALKQQQRPSEIYSDLGYEQLSAFSAEFKKYFGVAPQHYLQKINEPIA